MSEGGKGKHSASEGSRAGQLMKARDAERASMQAKKDAIAKVRPCFLW